MATYDEILKEHREHLRKGRAIQIEANRFLSLEPSPLVAYDPDEYSPAAMEAAFQKRHEWEMQLLDIYRREIEARDAER